jgi:acyl-CoA synthetase (AMP-forming)/AMP-acid ligase II
MNGYARPVLGYARPALGYGNLGNMLRTQALERPEQTACVLIDGTGSEIESATYADIDRYARALAVTIGERIAPGSRVLIMCPPGTDFLIGFFACQYAGLIAVPVVCPDVYNDDKGTRARLAGIAADCAPAAVLTSVGVAERLSAGDLGRIDILLVSDSVPELADLWRERDQDEAAPAVFQYTSGTSGTATPSPSGAWTSGGASTGCRSITAWGWPCCS